MSDTIRYEDVTDEQWQALSDCYWGPPDEERYSDTDAHDAIERLIDNAHPTPVTEIGTLEIVAMRPVSLDGWNSDWEFNRVSESLEEEYGDPDGDPWEPTERVKEAWQTFAAAVRAEYSPWLCNEAFRVEVDPVTWARRHQPDLLDDDADAGGGPTP